MTTKEEQKEKLEIKPSSKIGFIIFVAISLGVAIYTIILLILDRSPHLLFIFVPICFFLTLAMTIISIFLKKTKKETDFMVFVLLVMIAGVLLTIAASIFLIFGLIFLIGHM